jgi:hypothetical protein
VGSVVRPVEWCRSPLDTVCRHEHPRKAYKTHWRKARKCRTGGGIPANRQDNAPRARDWWIVLAKVMKRILNCCLSN